MTLSDLGKEVVAIVLGLVPEMESRIIDALGETRWRTLRPTFERSKACSSRVRQASDEHSAPDTRSCAMSQKGVPTTQSPSLIADCDRRGDVGASGVAPLPTPAGLAMTNQCKASGLVWIHRR